MKEKGKLLVIALLLLVIGASVGTYAIYRSSKTGTGTLSTAGWSIKLGGTDIASSTVLNFDMDDITWTSNPGKNGKIAPGAKGTIQFEIDATGSEVDVIYTAEAGDVAGKPSGLTVSVENGSGTIAYNATNMKKTVTLNVEWSGAESDSAAKDVNDLRAQGTTFNIPVTLTAKQAL